MNRKQPQEKPEAVTTNILPDDYDTSIVYPVTGGSSPDPCDAEIAQLKNLAKDSNKIISLLWDALIRYCPPEITDLHDFINARQAVQDIHIRCAALERKGQVDGQPVETKEG